MGSCNDYSNLCRINKLLQDRYMTSVDLLKISYKYGPRVSVVKTKVTGSRPRVVTTRHFQKVYVDYVSVRTLGLSIKEADKKCKVIEDRGKTKTRHLEECLRILEREVPKWDRHMFVRVKKGWTLF